MDIHIVFVLNYVFHRHWTDYDIDFDNLSEVIYYDTLTFVPSIKHRYEFEQKLLNNYIVPYKNIIFKIDTYDLTRTLNTTNSN